MQTLEKRPLTGTVALVTGGSRGIGAGIVRRLAADGAAVAFTYLSSEAKAQALVAEVEASGGAAFAIKADSASEADIQNAVATAVKAIGPLHTFVNSAGVLSRADVTTLTTEDLDRLLTVNVLGAVIGIQAAAGAMKDGGRIVTRADRH